MAPWLALATDGMLLAALVVIWAPPPPRRTRQGRARAAFWAGHGHEPRSSADDPGGHCRRAVAAGLPDECTGAGCARRVLGQQGSDRHERYARRVGRQRAGRCLVPFCRRRGDGLLRPPRRILAGHRRPGPARCGSAMWLQNAVPHFGEETPCCTGRGVARWAARRALARRGVRLNPVSGL
jgi:hypothetical protein